MNAFGGQGIEIGREGCDKGFSLTGLHLCNLTLVQDHAANHLDIEMPLAKRSLGRFAHQRKGFGQDVVHRLAGGQPLPEYLGASLDFLV